jgi:hypothetical protein
MMACSLYTMNLSLHPSAPIRGARTGQAEKAIMGLHGKHTMPSMTNTIQLSLAKGEEMEVERPDNKLFIGMLSRTCTEEEVRALISPFGAVEEVYIMKDKATGQSKATSPKSSIESLYLVNFWALTCEILCQGCAFVKFATKEGATSVIDNLHQKLTMPGATQPLIAKWADPPKPKAPGLGGAMGMMVHAHPRCAHTHTRTFMYVCMYVRVCVLRARVYIYLYIYIYIYILYPGYRERTVDWEWELRCSTSS